MHVLLVAALLLAAPAATAQHRHGGHGLPASGAAAQPYAGLETRRVKALPAESEADLPAGRGMAVALAAELNAHPGPMHVLEHAAALQLTPAQRARAEALEAAMRGEAQALGARIVALEGELDALFAGGRAEAAAVATLAERIGALGGRLRGVHLLAHVEMRAALTPEQVAAYDRLRGYRR
jgi:Spy/CpxP family protein refolding chaperone